MATAESALLLTYKRRLLFRIAVFIACILLYFLVPTLDDDILNFGVNNLNLLHAIWVILALDMIIIFSRRSKVSMGSIKQFKRNYIEPKVQATKETLKKARRTMNIQALKVILAWVLLNGIVATLYYTKIIRNRDLFLISAAYYVADLICIIYFCPFQKWIMRNRCCTTCRIFNWDQLMMVTPLLFIPSLYSWTLGGLALIAFLVWEYNFYAHTERFLEISNDHLKCVNCTDKLCFHRPPIWPKVIKEVKAKIDQTIDNTIKRKKR